jgi:hypothetical protein
MPAGLKAFQETFYALTLGDCDWTQAPETIDTLLEKQAESGTPAMANAATLFQKQDLKRLRQYQWMVFFNLADTLETVYPFTKQLLGDRWQIETQGFMQAYPPPSFQLYECITRFPDYLNQQEDLLTAFPFIVELASHEVLEAELLRMPDTARDLQAKLTESSNLQFNSLTVNDFLQQYAPVINPAAKPLECLYPIHQVIEQLRQSEQNALSDSTMHTTKPTLSEIDWQKLEPQALALWVYRDAAFDCRSFQVNPLTLTFLNHCLDIANERPLSSYNTLFQHTLESIGLTRTAELEQHFLAFIQQIEALGILLGSLPVDNL